MFTPMKTLNIIFCLMFALSFTACSSVKKAAAPGNDSLSTEYKTLRSNGSVVYSFNTFDITLIPVIGNLNFIYNPVKPASLKEIAEKGSWNVLVNASYFAGSASKAKHVGLLNIYGKLIAQKEYDKQLTHIVRYNKKLNSIFFYDYNGYEPVNDSSTLEIQTGPIVIENNKLASNYISACINGGRKAERTLIAAIDDKPAFFIVVRDKVSLTELGNFLLQVPIFAGKKLDVMNLDGGSSTSLYLSNFPQLNFKDSKQLPFLLGIK